MAKKRREPREKTEGIDYLKPINVLDFGSDNDPCFGKLYNLNADACKRCGDSELCGAVFAQKQNKQRSKQEKKNRFKDIELHKGNTSLEKWVKDKKEEGLSRSEIIKKAKKTFGSTREEIKNIYKKL